MSVASFARGEKGVRLIRSQQADTGGVLVSPIAGSARLLTGKMGTCLPGDRLRRPIPNWNTNGASET